VAVDVACIGPEQEHDDVADVVGRGDPPSGGQLVALLRDLVFL
jgi:hypothetical protein